jgi:hypothetical protein
LFVENQGQWPDASVKFALQGSGANVLLTDTGPVFQLFQRETSETSGDGTEPTGLPDPLALSSSITQSAQFTATFDGANAVAPVGLDQAETVCNYFVGDEATWRTSVPTFQKVAYPDLYDGIDLQASAQENGLKYEFRVAAGADYQQIQVTLDGANGLSLAPDGSLHIATSLGEVVDAAPSIYQDVGGVQVAVAGGFALIDTDTYAFSITGAFDPSTDLIIDPQVVWSTYLGGTGMESNYGNVGVDQDGNPLVTGNTTSINFSGTNNTNHGGQDAFVAKVSPSGTLLWATYIGGSALDGANAIAADAVGNIVVAGTTFGSTDLAGEPMRTTAGLPTPSSRRFPPAERCTGRHISAVRAMSWAVVSH